jgi:hypothetical protein
MWDDVYCVRPPGIVVLTSIIDIFIFIIIIIIIIIVFSVYHVWNIFNINDIYDFDIQTVCGEKKK